MLEAIEQGALKGLWRALRRPLGQPIQDGLGSFRASNSTQSTHRVDGGFFIRIVQCISQSRDALGNAHAPEGKVSLEDYPRIRAWLARIEALPRFVPMVRTPIGLAA